MILRRRYLSLLTCCLAVLGCRQAAAAFFDLPPREPPAPEMPVPAEITPTQQFALDTIRPPIEDTLNPDSAVAMLPKDSAGNIDWVAAIRQGVIKPRGTLEGYAEPINPFTFRFGFDFSFPGPNPTFDAYFPHSVHTEWIDCAQCHDRIFPYRNTPITMSAVFSGQYCGECHGKVAYPVETGCERCHRALTIPPGRANPDLIGTIQLVRATRSDTSVAGDESSGNAGLIATTDLPNATFPHWVHRIRYKCKVCHMALFEPRAGANSILMVEIQDGQACGQCHNGETAFRAGFGECQRCHIPGT